MKHKHYDLIIAWANGAKIEVKDGYKWIHCLFPTWNPNWEYRIKPDDLDRIPPISITGVIELVPGYCKFRPPGPTETPNIELVFVKNKLVSAEVLINKE